MPEPPHWHSIRAMDGGKVAELSLREFADKLLPIPHELVSTLFPESRIAAIAEAFEEMAENYVRRACEPEDGPRCPKEDRLAMEFVSDTGIWVGFVVWCGC